MSIPPNSPWRGCAAYFPQPVSNTDVLAAQSLTETIYYFNCRELKPPLPDIEYRDSTNEYDLTHHVFRWDSTGYEQIFREGFVVRRQDNTPDNIFYNLDHYVHYGGRPLGNDRPANYTFVSTTLDSGWCPSIKHESGSQPTIKEVWRYEIYAPGGIWVAETLGDRYKFPAQDEVCYVAGIARQYVRSAQRFRLIATADSRFTKKERVDALLIINGNFNPQSNPPRLIKTLWPVDKYKDENGKTAKLVQRFFNQNLNMAAISTDQHSGQQSNSSINWYANEVTKVTSYIDAAYRTSRANEVCLFIRNQYVLLTYTPGTTTGDRISKGPTLIGDTFTSLKGSSFAEYGVTCSFASHDANVAYIFSGTLAAKLNYANNTIIIAPVKITKMFPFLKGTVFKSGIDAGFESKTRYEAYIFSGDQFGVIDYGSAAPKLVGPVRQISDGFPGLRNTIFQSGIEAAFASHRVDQAYVFKGDSFALINLASGGAIVGGVKKIVTDWSSLRIILPYLNESYDY
ncbi:hypothetical protein RND81_09G261100 [Saponaria officinalis]|uniref:Pierisin-like domain-containing protein n=1 Tax=Saponaria officinalis TaxID=3572 RepID=A0AAW1ISN3_SAPOF